MAVLVMVSATLIVMVLAVLVVMVIGILALMAVAIIILAVAALRLLCRHGGCQLRCDVELLAAVNKREFSAMWGGCA